MVIIVNASGAREGGALTILNGYCSAKSGDILNRYIILSPFKPEVMPLNSKWIKFETRSVFTTLFAILGVMYYYISNRADKIVSFSNVNTLFPLAKKVTYFHNLNICYATSLKMRLIRAYLRLFNSKREVFIFQTPYVLRSFSCSVRDVFEYKICWPGVSVLPCYASNQISKNGCKKILCIISDVSDENKNFWLVVDIAKYISDFGYEVVVTCESSLSFKGLSFVGSLSPQEISKYIDGSEAILVCSQYESLGLPIFEALQKNTAVLALDKPYLKGLYEMFGIISGIYTFRSVREIPHLLDAINVDTSIFYRKEYEVANWKF